MNDELNIIISYIYLNIGDTKPSMSKVSVTIPNGLNATIDDLYSNGDTNMLQDIFRYCKEDLYEDLIIKLLKDELAIDAISIVEVTDFVSNRVINLKNKE